jgi:Putative lumazine-binding
LWPLGFLPAETYNQVINLKFASGEKGGLMKKLILVCAILSGVVLVAVLPASTRNLTNAEDAGVRACIEHYFRGHATGDGENFRRAFHPDAKLFFIRDGKVTQWTLEEYAGRASGKPAPDEAQRKRRIESIDITGNAAIAKIVLDYPSVTFTDYMSLLKIGDEWKIVNKTFHANPKART